MLNVNSVSGDGFVTPTNVLGIIEFPTDIWHMLYIYIYIYVCIGIGVGVIT
jgi:hypothetical protein